MADQSNVVLPKELRLAAPATMPQSRSYMFKQQAALSNYTPGDTIQINLPRLQRSYLTKDSYLEFEVEFTYKTPATNFLGAGLTLDRPGAFGLIDRIEVYDYLGSTQLESTAGFGQLVSLLQDTSVTAEEYGGHYEATCGGQHTSVSTDWERWGGTPGINTNYQMLLMRKQQPTIGDILDYGDWANDVSENKATASVIRTIRKRYHLPLFSFLGLLSPKYAPLHNGYTIMITLQSANNALISAGYGYTINTPPTIHSTSVIKGSDVNFKILNARMCCQILELGPIAESMLLSTTGGQPMIVTTKAYRAYNTSVPANSANFKLDLNINVASLTNILWFMRPQAVINNPDFATLSCRQRNFLESWYFQYGSSILPQTQGITAFKPVSNNVTHLDFGSECFIELLKARHLYNQPNQNHSFNKWNYAYDNFNRFQHTVANKHVGTLPANQPIAFRYPAPNSFFEQGKFACGLDLELVSGRTNEIICGMNTNGMNTAIFGTFNATAAAVAAPTIDDNTVRDGIWVEPVRVDAYCEYDAFINISPGIASTVSF
jgi:hypothetical protein